MIPQNIHNLKRRVPEFIGLIFPTSNYRGESCLTNLVYKYKIYAMKSNNTFRFIGGIVSIGLFAAALFTIHHNLKHYHLADIVAEIHQIPSISLLTAIALTILDYFVLTFYDTLAVRYLHSPLKYAKIAPASFVGYAFTHNLNILGGSTARYRIYSALGLSPAEIAKLVAFCSITFWIGFLTIAGASFICFYHQVPATTHIPLWLIRPIGAIFLAMVAGYIIYIFYGKRIITIRDWQIEKPSFSIFTAQLVISCADWIIACGVLYVLLPKDIEIGFKQFVGFFVLSQIFGFFSNVPGGLGVFETAMILFLSRFNQSPAIFGSLLIYRLIYYISPFSIAVAILAIHELLISRHLIRRAENIFEKWSSKITPTILALSSFIAGVILLVSGALPSVPERMKILHNILPIAAIELSHFSASIVGALLVLLARSLQRRINAAYIMTVILLAGGIIFSLLKGFDYEETVILSLILLAFLPCRKEFYRNAAIFTRRFEPMWFVMIFIVIVCSIWIGFFSYRHIEYANEIWWKFALHGDAPRFLRATLGIVVVVFIYGFMQLIFPAKPETAEASQEIITRVQDIIKSFDKTYANIALLGDKQFLFNDKKNAFLMYAVEGRSWITMGGPVGPESEWNELIWKFRELCDYYDGWPVFYHIDNIHLDYYLDIGLSFFKLGEEAMVDLQKFTLQGSENSNLRNSHNKIRKLGYIFEILPQEQTIKIIDTLKEISDAWLKDKNTREKRFSIGNFDKKYISYFPTAVIRRQGKIEAFANIWTTGPKKELSIDLMRHLPDCVNGIMDFLFTELLLWGQNQGYEWFNLGMAPLSGMADNELAPMWHKFGTFIFKQGEYFYNFKGLRQYKQKFHPVWEPKYLACPNGLALPIILKDIVKLISGGLMGIIKK